MISSNPTSVQVIFLRVSFLVWISSLVVLRDDGRLHLGTAVEAAAFLSPSADGPRFGNVRTLFGNSRTQQNQHVRTSSSTTTALNTISTASRCFVRSTLLESPIIASSNAAFEFEDLFDDNNENGEDEDEDENDVDDRIIERHRFENLCDAIHVRPFNVVRLQTDENTGVRGVYLNHPVKKGETIVSVPLDACLRDTEIPSWFQRYEQSKKEQQQRAEDTIPSSSSSSSSSSWATRLAASLIDVQLQRPVGGNIDNKGTNLWLSLLPNPDYLRASLPIHWSIPILESACCTALELAVDQSYFARAEALADLMEAVVDHHEIGILLTREERQRLCENALDIVQTRTCRVSSILPFVDDDDMFDKDDTASQSNSENEEKEVEEIFAGVWSPPLRVLAPVFDFINHPDRMVDVNAEFVTSAADGGRLVVRALRDMDVDEQVYISYGEDSTSPAWKCMASYGFCPTFDASDADDPSHVAEVYLDGVRYEVGPSTIPEDLVLAAIGEKDDEIKDDPDDDDEYDNDEVMLTPDIAIRLSKRLSDVAYQLLLDPIDRYYTDEEFDHIVETPSDVLSAQVAASLRWNQHRILLTCSLGLREWAIAGDPSLTSSPNDVYNYDNDTDMENDDDDFDNTRLEP